MVGSIDRARRTSRRGWCTGVAVAAALGMALVSAGPAQAIGNNRLVHRSCGSNWIASGGPFGGPQWAQTVKNSGSCSGTLSVALVSNDGYQTPRVYGNNQSAYTEIWGINAVTGLHWGCNSCGPTWT